MRLWVLVPLAVAMLVAADLSTKHFDPVFEAIPSAVNTSMLVMTGVVMILGVFFATYAFPAEMESKVAYSVATKPVSRLELVAGKVLGLSLLLLVMLAAVGAGAYVYLSIRANHVQTLAAERLAEARTRAAHAADLNALESAAARGPLVTHRYRRADVGPDLDLAFPGDTPPHADATWILGETGMILAWDVSASPLREWSASAPGRLVLDLKTWRSPEAPDEKPAESPASQPADAAAEAAPDAPFSLTVSLYAPGSRVEETDPDEPAPITQVAVKLAPGGPLEVPVASWATPPAPGVLNVPPGEHLFVRVMSTDTGCLIGAADGSLRIIGPAGQAFQAPGRPDMRASLHMGRLTLVGRPAPPRQYVAYRFPDVPVGVLGEGDAEFEISALLDSWSPIMVEPSAVVTFIRPDTGARKVVRYTPEKNQTAIVRLDREFWHGGPLEVRVACETADDFLGVNPDSLRLRLAGDPYALHVGKAVLRVWMAGTVLVAAGVFISAYVGWYVSILFTGTFLLVGMVREFILTTFVGEAAAYLYSVLAPRVGFAAAAWLSERIVPTPDLTGMLPDTAISMGRTIAWAALGADAAWALATVAVLVAAGALLLRHREVGA
jgi:hypothetical protein